MKKTLLLFVLVMLLVSGSAVYFPVKAASFEDVKAADSEPLHPQDYLLTVDNIPQALQDKYSTYEFRNKEVSQSRFPEYFITESTLLWGENMRLISRIMVAQPDYLAAYDLRGNEYFDKVTQLQGIGENALLLESSFCSEVHFIKGNSIVVVSVKAGGDGSDVQMVAEMINEGLPDEFPSPDLLEIKVPGPAVQISLPRKYILQLFKSGDQGVFSYDAPDIDKLYIVARYPFSRFIKALWSIEQQAYVYSAEVDISMYDVIALKAEHSPRINSFDCGDYEIHYWVNGEFAANYPIEIR